MGNATHDQYQAAFEQMLFNGRDLVSNTHTPVFEQVADAEQSGQARRVFIENELRAGYTREAAGSTRSLRNRMVPAGEMFDYLPYEVQRADDINRHKIFSRVDKECNAPRLLPFQEGATIADQRETGELQVRGH